MSAPSSCTDRPIGVFDSGVGGLTVMRAVTDLLPREDIVYLGDTARVPYGNRAPETVRRYAINATTLLANWGVKALVVACNTASAFALRAVDDQHDMPVLGVIEPVAQTACAGSTAGSIGVIGTRGTVRSGCYPTALARLRPDLEVHQQPCPLLVPLAEEGWIDGEVPRRVATEYLSSLASTSIDSLILGCTHYPILSPLIATVIEDLVARPVTLYDSASSTAGQLRDALEANDLLKRQQPTPRGDATGRRHFLLTDIPDGFVPTAERFFGGDISELTHVDIPVNE